VPQSLTLSLFQSLTLSLVAKTIACLRLGIETGNGNGIETKTEIRDSLKCRPSTTAAWTAAASSSSVKWNDWSWIEVFSQRNTQGNNWLNFFVFSLRGKTEKLRN